MEYCKLGNTPYNISKIVMGSLTVGPMHKNLSPENGGRVIREALEGGVNLIDTAECYNNYAHIKEALKGYNKDVYITSKSYAYNKELMAAAFEDARRSLDRDKIDIFLLHEQESGLTIKGHWEAVEYLLEMKAKGKVGAVGISTHAVAAVRAAIDIPEIEVIHPIINMHGMGIIDGSRDDMLSAIADAYAVGKGLYGMKAFAGGKLVDDAKECLDWALTVPKLHGFAVGMKSPLEVRINLAWACGKDPDPNDLAKYVVEKRHIKVDENCVGCGDCLPRCGQRAIRIGDDGKATIFEKQCVLCGYCRDNCDNDAIVIY